MTHRGPFQPRHSVILGYEVMEKFSTGSPEVRRLDLWEVLAAVGDRAALGGDLTQPGWFSATGICLNFRQRPNAFLPEPRMVHAVEMYF